VDGAGRESSGLGTEDDVCDNFGTGGVKAGRACGGHFISVNRLRGLF